ncbi:MAG: putative dienelactone hydrolase [Pseudohongiellaceae bacterium]|jgi:predicted dienelactone hydrolase
MTIPTQSLHINLTFLLKAAVLSLSLGLFSAQFASAQDNTEGRYRPQGRQIAMAASREFGERLFEVRTYDPAPQLDEFAGGTVFYPLTLSFDAPVGLIVFVPGFRATQEVYDWWGPALASFGYAVMIIDTNSPTDSQAVRKDAAVAAISFLKSENSSQDSPLLGKLDLDKVALMGHSMGGGAVLQAALELNDEIDAVIPLSLYCCEPGQTFSGDFSALGVPSLIFASGEDTIAPPAQHAKALFDSIAADTPKAYVEFASGDHMIAANGGPDLETLGRMTLAWLKVHLEGKVDLTRIISSDGDKFSQFESTVETSAL